MFKFRKACALVISLICLITFSNIVLAQDKTRAIPAGADPAINLTVEREKADIYSKIGCITCKDMTIDRCNCPKSREMKAYIEALLETGVSREDIFYKVARKYSLKAIMDKQIKAEVEQRLLKEAGDKRPEVSIEPMVFDFGQVSKKQGIISRVVKIINKGTANLTIKNIKPLCSCTSASLKVGGTKSPNFTTSGAPAGWQAQLKPKEAAELDIILDLHHASVGIGKLIREVQVTTDDPVYPEVFVRVEAEVGD